MTALSPWSSVASPATRQIAGLRYRVDRFLVRVVAGPDRGAVAHAEQSELTVGTGEGNTMRLTDPAISRHHCALEATPDGPRMRDLGSTNGTRIAGCLVDTALLAPGARIAIGNTELVVESAPGEIAEELSADASFGGLHGTSVPMRRMFALLRRLAPTNASVLVEGETGTGKSVLARALHDHSERSDGPFVVVDCGAIPPTLIESELFGHEKGAFTGAHASRIGFFEAAETGTVFLDEIGELPLEMQPKLLRVLESRVVRRVGTHEDIAVDARVIAATNRDLREEVNRGRFRSDLLYRLDTVRLRIPPLRERADDVPMLVTRFWAELSGDAEALPPPDLVARLSQGRWPGNVRELHSAVERAVLMDDPELWSAMSDPGGSDLTRGAAPGLHDATSPGDLLGTFRLAKARAVAVWERRYLVELMERCRGNISLASRTAQMNRNHLRTLLQRHGVAPHG